MTTQLPGSPHHEHYRLFRRMAGRSSNEAPRVATSLELLFDLIFVVAIAFAGAELHHSVIENHIGHGLLSYFLVFFVIWWAWMNFTWFASSFDTDDVPYRIAVFVQMLGALIIAAGVKTAFDGDWKIMVYGFAVMRLASVAQWIRASIQSPKYRKTCQRYAIALFMCQIGWIFIFFGPISFGIPGFLGMVILEFLGPMWAEKAGSSSWHPHHISERFGLLTIIVLGESILAAAIAVKKSISIDDAFEPEIFMFAFGALLIVFCMWWVYFEDTVAHHLNGYQRAFAWGYGHFFVFTSAAAAGAGLGAMVDYILGESHVSGVTTGLALAIPVAVYVVTVWLFNKRINRQTHGEWLFPAVALAILTTPWVMPVNALLIGLILVVFLGLRMAMAPKHPLDLQSKLRSY